MASHARCPIATGLSSTWQELEGHIYHHSCFADCNVLLKHENSNDQRYKYHETTQIQRDEDLEYILKNWKELKNLGDDRALLDDIIYDSEVNNMLVLLVYEDGEVTPPRKARRPLSAREYVLFCPRVPHDGGATPCAICLRALGRAPCRRLRACGHQFHGACLHTWLRRHDDRCPLCRRPAVPSSRP